MKIRDPKPLKRLETFLKGITHDDIVAVIHHTDPDGVTSGVLASKVVERLRGKQVDVRYNQPGNIVYILPDTVKMLRKKNVNKILITDLAVYEMPETIEQLSQFAEILVMDHHKIYTDVSGPRVTLINPSQLYEDVDSSTYCAAKVVFDFCGKHADISDLDWIAAIGTIGDATSKHWRPFLQGVCERLGIAPKKDWYATVLGQCAVVLSSAEIYNPDNVPSCYKVVYEAKAPRDILASPLALFRKEISAEVAYWTKHLKRFGKRYPNLELIIYPIKPTHNVKSVLSTTLSMERQGTTVIIIDTRGKKYSISARRQDGRVAVNDLLRECLKGLPEALGGGHAPAAGGTVRAEDYPEFEKRLLYRLSRLYKQ